MLVHWCCLRVLLSGWRAAGACRVQLEDVEGADAVLLAACSVRCCFMQGAAWRVRSSSRLFICHAPKWITHKTRCHKGTRDRTRLEGSENAQVL